MTTTAAPTALSARDLTNAYRSATITLRQIVSGQLRWKNAAARKATCEDVLTGVTDELYRQATIAWAADETTVPTAAKLANALTVERDIFDRYKADDAASARAATEYHWNILAIDALIAELDA